CRATALHTSKTASGRPAGGVGGGVGGVRVALSGGRHGLGVDRVAAGLGAVGVQRRRQRAVGAGDQPILLGNLPRRGTGGRRKSSSNRKRNAAQSVPSRLARARENGRVYPFGRQRSSPVLRTLGGDAPPRRSARHPPRGRLFLAR